jgi:DNA-binding protein YbaB
VSTNPFEGLDPDATLRALRQQADDLETKATQLRTELATATATATSPDGAVTVTLSPTGALQDITFSAKAATHSPDALGPLVMTAVRAAQREVSNRVTATMAAQFGDTETMDFITQFMPPPAETPVPQRDQDDDFSGGVLRRRPGRAQEPAPERHRRDDAGPGSLR